MKNFFDFVLWVFTLTTIDTFEEWVIVHRVKTEWIFSGTVRNVTGTLQDAGFLRSPKPMRRAQAMRYFAKQFPRAQIMHVDNKNKIITYSF